MYICAIKVCAYQRSNQVFILVYDLAITCTQFNQPICTLQLRRRTCYDDYKERRENREKKGIASYIAAKSINDWVGVSD